MRRAGAIVIVVTGLAVGCAPGATSVPPSTAPTTRGSLFDRPWVWLDDQGTRVALSQWRGTPIVLAAVFTTCQETCPRTLTKLRGMSDQFARDHRRAEFVVITIDPETDTPARLHAFRESRNLPGSWHLLTGGTDETAQLSALLGIHIMNMDTGMDAAHVVHDSKIMMFDAAGQQTGEYDVL